MIDPATPIHFSKSGQPNAEKLSLEKRGTGASLENAVLGGSELIGTCSVTHKGTLSTPIARRKPDRIKEGFRPLDSSNNLGWASRIKPAKPASSASVIFSASLFSFQPIDLMFM